MWVIRLGDLCMDNDTGETIYWPDENAAWGLVRPQLGFVCNANGD